MTTHKQVESNRRNAARSTGPNTVSGKRAASVNAIRHALSIPLDPLLSCLMIDELVDALDGEVPDPTQARTLAIRILEYERNLAHQRALFDGGEDFFGGQNLPDGSSAGSNEVQPQEMPGLLKLSGAGRAELAGMGLGHLTPKDLRQLSSLRKSGLKLIERTQRRRKRNDAVNSVRYLKRSSNQLFKFIRGL